MDNDTTITGTPRHTPLHPWHIGHQGRMVDFAGWSMPVQYESIVAEHEATRKQVTLFDVSHMGRIRFDGSQTAEFLDRIVTRRITDLKPGHIRYGLVCRDDGGILDDVLVYRLTDLSDQDTYWMVVNASNREKILSWLDQNRGNAGCEWRDLTVSTAMIAVQGPRALELIRRTTDIDMSLCPYYQGRVVRWHGEACIVSRTGYTGEDGCEWIVPADLALAIWTKFLECGKEWGVRGAGLGARDTLRLEAGMPLYGHELDETIDPLQAGLAFAVSLKDRDFHGREAILRRSESGTSPRRVGLRLAGRRVPRQHYGVVAEGRRVGEVSSGTFSPTFQVPLAMAYVEPAHAAVGGMLQVDIRGDAESATVVELPFYRRPNLERKASS